MKKPKKDVSPVVEDFRIKREIKSRLLIFPFDAGCDAYMRSRMASPKPEQESWVTSSRPSRRMSRGQVVGDVAVQDGPFHAGGDQIRGLAPPQVVEHHHGREDERTGIDLVHPRVLGRRAVGGLEQGQVVGHVGARSRPRPPTRAMAASER